MGRGSDIVTATTLLDAVAADPLSVPIGIKRAEALIAAHA